MKRIRKGYSYAYRCTPIEWLGLPKAPDRTIDAHLSRLTEHGKRYVVRVEQSWATMNGQRSGGRPLSADAVTYRVDWDLTLLHKVGAATRAGLMIVALIVACGLLGEVLTVGRI